MCSKLFDSQMLTTEMIHFRKYYQTYEVHAFLPLCSVTPVFCDHDSVSKWSRRVALARTYLDMASACLFRKLQYCMLYCGLLLCSKVTHIIDPHRRNTLRYFPSKRMDFRSSTGRLQRRQDMITCTGSSGCINEHSKTN